MQHKSPCIVQAVLVCDAGVKDPSGKTTLYGIFDTILSKSFPARYPQFAIFWKCIFETKGEMFVALEKPGGDFLVSLDKIVVDESKLGSAEGIYQLVGVEIPHPGQYKVSLFFNNKKVFSVPLTVKQIGEGR
ncbi:MAG: hypothetical protein LWW94_08505 [Candidatus Desulfofervidaceae bacterium]|nr:hypothetical protein [Candidatus Desulfofervidaceae bacterium]